MAPDCRDDVRIAAKPLSMQFAAIGQYQQIVPDCAHLPARKAHKAQAAQHAAEPTP
ncbi:MAG: hypothetical protein OD811_03950 [Alphaproteobacteria bacterium]